MIALCQEKTAQRALTSAVSAAPRTRWPCATASPWPVNFLSQENVVLTGACEAIVVDVQCIFPALGPLSKCFHTKFVTTSPIARMPDSEFIQFPADNAGENAKAIVKMAVENFKNRKPELVNIPSSRPRPASATLLRPSRKSLTALPTAMLTSPARRSRWSSVCIPVFSGALWPWSAATTPRFVRTPLTLS